jgi:hypothetical protein
VQQKLQDITAACNHNLVLALKKQDFGDIQVFLIAHGQSRGRTDERGATGNKAPDSCLKK